MADLFTGATAQSTTSVFTFGDSTVRLVVLDGDPWFVATDVASALGYRDAANAGRILAEHQKGTHIVSTPCGEQRVTIINESGLYRLVLRSRKPALLGNAPSHWPKTLRLWRGRVKALAKWLAISAAAIFAVGLIAGVFA